MTDREVGLLIVTIVCWTMWALTFRAYLRLADRLREAQTRQRHAERYGDAAERALQNAIEQGNAARAEVMRLHEHELVAVCLPLKAHREDWFADPPNLSRWKTDPPIRDVCATRASPPLLAAASPPLH